MKRIYSTLFIAFVVSFACIDDSDDTDPDGVDPVDAELVTEVFEIGGKCCNTAGTVCIDEISGCDGAACELCPSAYPHAGNCIASTEMGCNTCHLGWTSSGTVSAPCGGSDVTSYICNGRLVLTSGTCGLGGCCPDFESCNECDDTNNNCDMTCP